MRDLIKFSFYEICSCVSLMSLIWHTCMLYMSKKDKTTENERKNSKKVKGKRKKIGKEKDKDKNR